MGFIKRFLKNLLEEFLKNKKRSTRAFNPALCKEMIPWDKYPDSPPIEGPCTWFRMFEHGHDCNEIIYINDDREYEINIGKDEETQYIPAFYIDGGKKATLNFYDHKKIKGFCNPYPQECKYYAPVYIEVWDGGELIINTVGSEMPMVNGKPFINYIGGSDRYQYCNTEADRNYKVSINYNWTPPPHKKKKNNNR